MNKKVADVCFLCPTTKQTNKQTNIFLNKRIKSLNCSALCRAMLWKGALLTLGMMSLTIVLQSQIHITTLHWTALMAESSCHYKKNLLSFHKFFFIMHKIFTIIFATCASENYNYLPWSRPELILKSQKIISVWIP